MKIIIIDDDPLSLSGLKMMLEQQGGHQCAAFQYPQEAVKEYQSGGYEVIISDIRMPEIDGLEVYRQIRAIDPRARVILITGHQYDEAEVRATAQELFAFFTKPLRAHLILEALHRIETETTEPVKP